MVLVNLNKGQKSVGKAWYQISRKMLSVLSTACGSAMLKVLEVPPTLYRQSKLSACSMARVYGAQP